MRSMGGQRVILGAVKQLWVEVAYRQGGEKGRRRSLQRWLTTSPYQQHRRRRSV